MAVVKPTMHMWSVWTLWRETLMATSDATAIRIIVVP
jgi:hypothetical protein